MKSNRPMAIVGVNTATISLSNHPVPTVPTDFVQQMFKSTSSNSRVHRIIKKRHPGLNPAFGALPIYFGSNRAELSITHIDDIKNTIQIWVINADYM